jgi:hypothetical protein
MKVRGIMARTTIFFSIVLIALGLYGYFGSPDAEPSKTALIPAAFGILLLIPGLIALNDRFRMHAMHAAAAVGLLGLVMAGGRGGMKIGSLFSDDPNVNKRPIMMVLAMAAVCLVFVGLCVKSFIDARRRQAAERRASSDDAA